MSEVTGTILSLITTYVLGWMSARLVVMSIRKK